MNPYRSLALFALFLATAAFISAADPDAKPKAEKEAHGKGRWISLFNGKDLTGWTPKIRYEELGEDPKNTFRVEDGLLKVRYDKYDGFGEAFGHLFYEKMYSHYRIRVEYRFVGEQCKGGPGWAIRNSGIMVHGQDPGTMGKDQKFPVSIEVQLLAGAGDGKERTTGNLCTPGTHVFFGDKLEKRHCIGSTSKTFHGDQWVTAEVEVRGNEVIRHIINGETVLEYQKPILDEGDPDAKSLIEGRGGEIALIGGTISLQSESHPCDFRKVEILVIED
jgi:hypothetical protein